MKGKTLVALAIVGVSCLGGCASRQVENRKTPIENIATSKEIDRIFIISESLHLQLTTVFPQ